MMIEIEGQQIEVDDTFAKLTPEQQNATVDEIAASLKLQPKPAQPVEAAEAQPYGMKEGLQDFNSSLEFASLPGWASRLGRKAGEYLAENGADIATAIPGAAVNLAKDVVDSGVQAVTLPKRVMNNEVRMWDDAGRTSPELIAEAFNTAMWTSPTSPAMTVRQPAEAVAKEVVDKSAKVANTEGNLVNQAAKRIGVQLPRSVVSDSKLVQAAGKWFEQQPIVGSPMLRASEKATQQLDDAAKGVKDAFGSGSTYNAGGEMQDATRKYAKEFLKSQEKKRYDAVDGLVTPNVVTPLRKTGETVVDILAGRQNAKLPDGSAVRMVRDAVSSEGLNYQGIKKLRSYVGETLDDPMKLAKAGMSEADLKRVYAALSDDLRSAVERGGGKKALAEFEKANAYSARASKEREALQKIIGSKEPEAIVDTIARAAGTNSRASLNKLFQARKAVDKETWDELASAVVEKMGRDADGNFSPERWITERGKLSPTGKAVLFNTTGKKELMQHLDDIDTVSRRLKELNKDFGNSSGTGRSNAMLAAGAAVVKAPLRLLSGVLGGRIMAKYLSQPVEAKAVADYMKALELAQKAPGIQSNELLARRANALARIAANDLDNPKLVDSITYQLITGQKAAADQQDQEEVRSPEGYPETQKASDAFSEAYLQGNAL